MRKTIQKIELLAPAGSINIGIEALKAGADAVYIGGNKFGARASAISCNENNFNDLINFAHNNNKKVYVTFNTLIKENELNEIFDFCDYFINLNINSFIIQDLGVGKLINEKYNSLIKNNELELHASTQVGVGDIYTLNFLKSLGYNRIILKRELELNKIREICKEAKKLNIEIETFIHGSMCYSISGQCLMSSFIGGLSGNRGRCNAPCRHPYFINMDTSNNNIFTKTKTINHGYYQTRSLDNKEIYPLRMKDMCTIQDIGNMIDSGINSFKIEGRLRSESYVVNTVKIYKKYIDLFLKNRELYYAEIKKNKIKDENNLKATNNKGGFTNYLYVHNSEKMINLYNT